MFCVRGKTFLWQFYFCIDLVLLMLTKVFHLFHIFYLSLEALSLPIWKLKFLYLLLVEQLEHKNNQPGLNVSAFEISS